MRIFVATVRICLKEVIFFVKNTYVYCCYFTIFNNNKIHFSNDIYTFTATTTDVLRLIMSIFSLKMHIFILPVWISPMRPSHASSNQGCSRSWLRDEGMFPPRHRPGRASSKKGTCFKVDRNCRYFKPLRQGAHCRREMSPAGALGEILTST